MPKKTYQVGESGKKSGSPSKPVGPSPDRRVVQVKEGPLDRLRLQKSEGAEIAANMMEHGFKSEARTDSVYVWDEHEQHIATFSWRKGKGWCLLVRQPTLFAQHDLKMAVEEIQRCEAGIEAADQAWEKFKKAKTNKNWAAYQGALAAHFFRLYSGGDE